MDAAKPKMTEDLRKMVNEFLAKKLPLSSSEAKAVLEEMIRLKCSTHQIGEVLHTNPGTISVALIRLGISKPRKDQPHVAPEKTERSKEFVKELREAVYGSALAARHKNGIEDLWKNLCGKLQENENAPDFLKSIENFKAKIREIVWTPKALEALRGIVKTSVDLEKFCKYYAHIPIEMVKEKAREYTGLTSFRQSDTFLPGIGRLSDVGKFFGEELEFPRTSYEYPYDSGITSDRWAIRVLNGANLGIKHNRLIVENITRVALANGRRMGDQCVVITNPIDLDYRQGGGPHKILRSLVSGLNVDIQVLDPTYRKRAINIQKDPNSSELIYQTAAELFESIGVGIRFRFSLMAARNFQDQCL